VQESEIDKESKGEKGGKKQQTFITTFN